MEAPITWGNAFAAASVSVAMGWGLAFFASIYLVFCGGHWLLTRHVLPVLGIGRRIDPRPLRAGQVQLDAFRARAAGQGLFPYAK